MSNHLPPLVPGSEAASVADGIATVIRAKDEEIVALSKRVTTAEAEVARLTPWVSKLQASVISVTARVERIEKAARAVISAEKEFRPVRPSLYHDPLKFALEVLAAALPEGLSAATPECQMPAPAGKTTRTTPGADMEAEPVTEPSPVGSASSVALEIERLADQSRSLTPLAEAIKATATQIMSGFLPSVEANGGAGRD